MLSPDEAAMNRCFVDAARSVTVMVDSSKFSSQAIFRICEMKRVNCVITDSGVRDSDRRQLDALGPDGHPNSPVYGHLKLPHLN